MASRPAFRAKAKRQMWSLPSQPSLSICKSRWWPDSLAPNRIMARSPAGSPSGTAECRAAAEDEVGRTVARTAGGEGRRWPGTAEKGEAQEVDGVGDAAE